MKAVSGLVSAAVTLLWMSSAAAGSASACPDRGGDSAIVASDFVYETAPYKQAHASTIVETGAGTIAAAWFGGTRESDPDVSIWFARREGGRWAPAREVANGLQPDGSRFPAWNPVLFQTPGGALMLFYKVGPDPQRWWGMVTSSSDDGRSWSRPVRLPQGVFGPIKNKPVVLPDGSWLSPSSTETSKGWALHFERSSDGGKRWTSTAPVESPVGIDAIQPSILFHPDGALEAIARTRQGALAMTWSRDGGRSWSPLATIDLPNPNAGTDAVTMADGRHLIVYNHSGQQPSTPGKGRRYPLNVALSADGISWERVLTLESEPRPAGYAYPAVIQAADGLIHITYTWNRERIRHVVLDPRKCATAPHRGHD